MPGLQAGTHISPPVQGTTRLNLEPLTLGVKMRSVAMPWETNPVIYEINTRLWLKDLSAKYRRPVDLETVPSGEMERFAANGIDAVWLMGVWTRSSEGVKIARLAPGLKEEFRRALGNPDKEDIGASPYAILSYEVDRELGGKQALAVFRAGLHAFDIRLILDFVPNHMAVDTPLLSTNPDLFLHDALFYADSDDYFKHKVRGKTYTFAHGRDPYFPGWTDTVQVDYSKEATRVFMADLMGRAASMCDGFRCDMAQLDTPDVFEKTWGKAFDKKETFWKPAIRKVKSGRTDFLFIAEVYWGLEWELQQEGFDLTYDKTLYDRLRYSTPDDVRGHLRADISYQDKLIRFIENHDEERAPRAFHDKACVAALLSATVPGATLFHEGQFEGRSIRIPVQLTRRPVEPVDHEIRDFYGFLLKEIADSIYHNGDWRLLEVSSAGGDTYHNIVAYQWTMEGKIKIIAVNLEDRTSRGYVWPLLRLEKNEHILYDQITKREFRCDASVLNTDGLYVELEQYKAHIFDVSEIEESGYQDSVLK